MSSENSAAAASAERIAQLKRLQRRKGGLRSTLPVSTTDDARFYQSDERSPYRTSESNEIYAEAEYATNASERPRQTKAAGTVGAEPEYIMHAPERPRQSKAAGPQDVEPEYAMRAPERPRQTKAAVNQDAPNKIQNVDANTNIRVATAIGSLLSYIRSTETSPEQFIDPSYFNGCSHTRSIQSHKF